jgi:calcineurin-like phosphoesterase family protein
MHRVLINNFNASVPDDGITYFLGDMGVTDRLALVKTLNELNGTKVLVMGNHDKGMNAMYTAGFDVVINMASMVIANRLVTMSHCPLRGLFREDVTDTRGAEPGDMWHGEKRHTRFSIPDFGQLHLHGHIHSASWKTKSTKTTYNQYDVGVPANGYKPVSIAVIEAWIASLEKQSVK